jgi:hypothetical protein
MIGTDYGMTYRAIRKRNEKAATRGLKLYRFGLVRFAIHIWNVWRP